MVRLSHNDPTSLVVLHLLRYNNPCFFFKHILVCLIIPCKESGKPLVRDTFKLVFGRWKSNHSPGNLYQWKAFPVFGWPFSLESYMAMRKSLPQINGMKFPQLMDGKPVSHGKGM